MNLKLILYDFDGVMTNNKLFLFEDGKEAVILNRSDGLAVSYINKLNIEQAIVSTEENKVVTKRGKKLNIKTYQNIENKLQFVKEIIINKKISPEEVAFIGNDLNDLELIKFIPNSYCPKDSHPKVLKASKTVLNKKGGNGVIMAFFNFLAGENNG